MTPSDVQRLLTLGNYYRGAIDGRPDGPDLLKAIDRILTANAGRLKDGGRSWTAERRLVAAGQLVLDAMGYEPGGIDGDFGRNTIKALAAFQRAHVPETKNPGTILWSDASPTLQKLGIVPSKFSPGASAPVWVAEAFRKLGLHEVANNKTLREYLAANGKALGDPSKLPWCGDFVESVIAKTLPAEPLISNPFWALGWSKFGRAIKVVAVGNILTFKRNGGGHVGFCVGHDATHFHVLGGNQSNAVTIARIAKNRLDAMRWPSTVPMPTKSIAQTTINATISRNEA